MGVSPPMSVNGVIATVGKAITFVWFHSGTLIEDEIATGDSAVS